MIMELMLHDEDGNDNLCKGGYRDIDKGGGVRAKRFCSFKLGPELRDFSGTSPPLCPPLISRIEWYDSV